MPKLIVHLPDGTEISHELTENVITIGRVQDNVIQIEDASVSSHHAELTLVDGKYHLKDLDSTNGTRLNGHGFTEGLLHEGDQIRFGKIETRYASVFSSESRPLPDQEEVASAPAASSSRPVDFTNASPFKTKAKKKDPVAKAILAFAVVAVLAFAGAVVSIFMLKPPQ